MNNDLEALARRAVACPAWRWMPRMVDQYGNTMLHVVDGTPVGAVDYRGNYIDLQRDNRVNEARRLWATSIPDFADRATLGCLEGLVIEAWDAPLMYVEPCGGAFEPIRYEVRNLLGRIADGHPVQAFVNISAPTKVEALVLALERAPLRREPT